MKKYQPALYDSPIDLPARRIGAVEVKHRELAGDVTVIGMRQAVLRGLRPAFATLKAPRRIHELYDDKRGLWMTDLPEELNQIAEALYYIRPQGDVLVGGLGLGIMAKALLNVPGVNSVTVIERNKNIIKLCASKELDCVINANIFTFLKNNPRPYDYYLLDTWQGTNEMTWWEEVMPLRRIIRNKHGRKPHVHCWAEDIMLGQVRRVLLGEHRVWHYKNLPQMTEEAANKFLKNIGLLRWEHLYGNLID